MIVHAVLPPPVTGMTLCTEAVVNAVAQRLPVHCYNWSNGSPMITTWFRLVKGLRALTTPVRLLCTRRHPRAVFYMPANAGFAVLFNLLACAAARLRGYRCVLHHHYYRYLDRFELRIKLLSALLGPRDIQIVLCPEMERRFRALYGQHLSLAVMPSTIQILECDARSNAVCHVPRQDGSFYLGHLTNLQVAKGLDLVFAVVRELLRQGRDVKLVLAGPTCSAVERRLIEAAQLEFNERLDYRGPAYGSDKNRFFQDVDAIVYPTRNDAQPLVVMESFSHGRPVLAYGRGCIPGMMPKAQWSIGVNEDFVQAAVAEISRWMDDRAVHMADCRLARQTFETALVEAQAALDNFVNWVCCESNDEFVKRGGDT